MDGWMDNVQWTKSVIESMYKSAHGFIFVICVFVCEVTNEKFM